MAKGKRISSLKSLVEASLSRKSVICPDADNRPMPAAFLISMQGWIIHQRIRKGLFVYRPSKRKCAFRKIKIFDNEGNVAAIATIAI